MREMSLSGIDTLFDMIIGMMLGMILAGSYLIYYNLIDQNNKRLFDMHQVICSGDDIKYWNAQTLIQHQVELVSVPCLLSE